MIVGYGRGVGKLGNRDEITVIREVDVPCHWMNFEIIDTAKSGAIVIVQDGFRLGSHGVDGPYASS